MGEPAGGESVGGEVRVAPGVSVRTSKEGATIRIAFQFRGRECREPLVGLEVSPQNIRYAVNLRGEILNAIARGTFNYADHFPDSENARNFGFTRSDKTIGEGLRAWFAVRRLASSTRLTYSRVIDRYLLPWFDKVRVRDLTAPMIRSRVMEVKDEDGVPVTLKTAHNILTPLSAYLELEVGDGTIDTNPMTRVKLEQYWPEARVTSDFEADPFAWTEMVAIFGACAGGPEGEEADHWRFAFGTGMRPSEQIALAWPRCDLANHRVRVLEARVTGFDGPAVKGPKSEAGRRWIDLTRGAWEALQRQQERTQRVNVGVWRDPRSRGPWASEEALRKRFKRICAKAGVRYRYPYQTRHTFGSTLLALGYPEMWVAVQMGHETVEMLHRHYGRWIEQGSDPMALRQLVGFFSHVSPTVVPMAVRRLAMG